MGDNYLGENQGVVKNAHTRMRNCAENQTVCAALRGKKYLCVIKKKCGIKINMAMQAHSKKRVCYYYDSEY